MTNSHKQKTYYSDSMNEFRKALDTIALEHAQGRASDDLLVKACDSYKNLDDSFVDDLYYHACVSKSLHDHLNGIEQNAEICKALVPGQTKVIDGVVYVWTATPNAKTQYDWRVFQGKKRIGRQVTNQNDLQAKNKHANDLFPDDISTLTVVNAHIGGSTGAQLVADSQGNQYILKRGKNTSNQHLVNEYNANQLYSLLGTRTPDYELYQDGQDVVLLSRYIPGLSPIDLDVDGKELSKRFINDIFLNNWDVLQNNDNCLRDSSGKVYRVDNGGTMEYRARGGTKPFNDLATNWKDMFNYNPKMAAELTDADIKEQIDHILSKRDDVLGYLEQAGEDNLKQLFETRFQQLESIQKKYMPKQVRKVLPRQLTPPDVMYRDIPVDDINQLYNATAPGSSYYHKLEHKEDGVGWDLLSRVCKERGFDARPQVVSEDEYWKAVAKSPYQLFRGLDPAPDDPEFWADEFKYADDCFYGTQGVHGEGIYFHVNDGINNADNSRKGYKKSDAYRAAQGYAGYAGNGPILEACIAPDAKVAMWDDLYKEIEDLIGKGDPNIEAQKQILKDAEDEFKKAQIEYDALTVNIEDTVKQQMGWNEDAKIMMEHEISNTGWGNVTPNGDPDYPTFDAFFPMMKEWVTKNGGTVTERKPNSDVYTFKLPHSDKTFMFSRFQYENNAIKQKSAFHPAYNYPVKRFEQWMYANHYNIIERRVDEVKKESGDLIEQARKDLHTANSNVDKERKILSDMKRVKNPDSNVIDAIYENVINDSNKEPVGIYAAMKGYDAFIRPRGNGGPNSFMIVLNRSKIIVKQ